MSLLISASLVARIIGVGHRAWPAGFLDNMQPLHLVENDMPGLTIQGKNSLASVWEELMT
jgi:hypothetical protein